MPTLNEYTKESSQSGYYVRANVGGDSPVTLQVSALAQRLFLMLGYRADDNLPTKLVWSMYDVGLLYTLNPITSIHGGGSDGAESIFDQLDFESSLSEEKEDEIVSQLEQYDGPDSDEVEELINRLQSGGDFSSPEYGEKGDLPLLQQWAKNSEKYEKLTEEFEGYESFAEASIQTFARHPYLSAPPIWFESEGGIRYRLEHDNYDLSIYVSDYRFHDDYAFKVVVEHMNGEKEIAEVSRNGYITEYTNHAGRLGLRMRVSAMLDWVIPDERIIVDNQQTSTEPLTPDYHSVDETDLSEIAESEGVDEDDLVIAKIDRISNSGNPVFEFNGVNAITDQGEPGRKYVVKMLSKKKAEVITELPKES